MESLLVCGLEATLSVLGRTKPARLSRSRIIWPLMLTSRGELEWRLQEGSITAVRAKTRGAEPCVPQHHALLHGGSPPEMARFTPSAQRAAGREDFAAGWQGLLQSGEGGFKAHHHSAQGAGGITDQIPFVIKKFVHPALALRQTLEEKLLYLGEMLTSKIQGLRFSSSMISNPKSSWQQ